MLKEITSIEEMAALPSGTYILNKFRIPGSYWKETTFRLRINDRIPYLLGHYGTCHRIRETDFSDDDRYFVEVES